MALDGQHAGGIDRDHGSLQDHALEQAGDGRDFVALGHARFLGQGQALPYQEGTHQEHGPRIAHTARVGELGQFVGEGAQSLQEDGVGKGMGRSMRAATRSVRMVHTPWNARQPFLWGVG